MNKSIYLLLLLFLAGCFNDENKQLNRFYDDGDKQSDLLLEGVEHIEFLYQQQRGGVMVTSSGRIAKLFGAQSRSDTEQKILIRLSSGRKLLIKHNTEQGGIVPELRIGETLVFSGIYNWNNKGGIIQSTHQQANMPARSGWLKYQDITYQ